MISGRRQFGLEAVLGASSQAKRWHLVLLFFVSVTLIVVTSALSSPTQAQITVVATTGMIADTARHIGGNHVEVIGLMGPGVDPHLYRASHGDVRRLVGADLILYNGLGLEGRMADILRQMERQKHTVAVTEYIPRDLLIEAEGFEGHADPHVWFDVELWKIVVQRILDALTEADPEHASAYRTHAASYLEQLDELHAYAVERIGSIPKERRVLVTAHDAFGYFGRAYDMEVVGLQGISTDTEAGVRDIQNLVHFIVERGIRAVFVESSLSPKPIEAVVQGAASRQHKVSIGAELYSDALGPAESDAGTYIGMFRHNIDAIVEALAE